MATLQAPATHGARTLHDAWHTLIAAPRRTATDTHARHQHGAAARHQMPAPHLMTDPDVFDVFGEDDAA